MFRNVIAYTRRNTSTSMNDLRLFALFKGSLCDVWLIE